MVIPKGEANGVSPFVCFNVLNSELIVSRTSTRCVLISVTNTRPFESEATSTGLTNIGAGSSSPRINSVMKLFFLGFKSCVEKYDLTYSTFGSTGDGGKKYRLVSFFGTAVLQAVSKTQSNNGIISLKDNLRNIQESPVFDFLFTIISLWSVAADITGRPFTIISPGQRNVPLAEARHTAHQQFLLITAMHTMTTFTDPALVRPVHVKIMQVLITISEPGGFAGTLIEKGVFVMAIKTKSEVLILVGNIEFLRVKGFQIRLIV